MSENQARRPGWIQRAAFWRVRRLVRSGDAARDLKDWPRAIEHYEAFLALRPTRWRIRVQLGHAYKETGDISAAEAAYRSASEAAPDDADVFLQLARALALNGKFEAARKVYQKSRVLDPGGTATSELEALDRDHPSRRREDHHIGGKEGMALWRNLANARAARDQRRWSEAAALYRAYLDKEPRSAAVWEEFAGALEAAARHHEALEAIRKATFLNPTSLPGLALKATILRSLGRIDASAQLWMEVARRTGAAAATDEFGQPLATPTL